MSLLPLSIVLDDSLPHDVRTTAGFFVIVDDRVAPPQFVFHYFSFFYVEELRSWGLIFISRQSSNSFSFFPRCTTSVPLRAGDIVGSQLITPVSLPQPKALPSADARHKNTVSFSSWLHGWVSPPSLPLRTPRRQSPHYGETPSSSVCLQRRQIFLTLELWESPTTILLKPFLPLSRWRNEEAYEPHHPPRASFWVTPTSIYIHSRCLLKATTTYFRAAFFPCNLLWKESGI